MADEPKPGSVPRWWLDKDQAPDKKTGWWIPARLADAEIDRQKERADAAEKRAEGMRAAAASTDNINKGLRERIAELETLIRRLRNSFYVRVRAAGLVAFGPDSLAAFDEMEGIGRD